jgi:hypothetical protein
MQATADGDVGDLGMEATQLFGLAGAPPGMEGSDDEDTKAPPDKISAKKGRKISKPAAATAVEAAAAEEDTALGNELAIVAQTRGSFRKKDSKRKAAPRKSVPEEASQVVCLQLHRWVPYHVNRTPSCSPWDVFPRFIPPPVKSCTYFPKHM